MENKQRYTSVISSRAAKEIHDSWDWYEARQKGLGDRFVEEVIRKINLIEHQPELYPNKYKSYRETLISVFPVLLIYRINKRNNIISIISVFHTARGIGKY